MAGDWIPMRLDLADDPAVMAMAEILGMPEPCVVGYLHTIWSWASRQCNAGSVTGVTLVSLGRVTRCENVPHAMAQVGWLIEEEIDGKPALHFPNWDRWMSQSAKQRALTARRVVTARLRKCNAASVTESLPEKRREEKSKRTRKKPPFPLCVPEVLDTPEFHIAWDKWQKHRAEIKKPLTPTSMEKQLETFASWGVARSVEAINHTIAQGWQGLREKEGGGAGNGHASKPDPLDEWMKDKADAKRK